MLCKVLNNDAGQRDPKLANRLMGILLSSVVQANAMLRREERRR
ncbi:MAG TPA: hypothetical protein VKB88_06465 [Bryobacteraceae bacterium]|nr:hypothetical protein [Bryobacteraceae bacterium]